MISNQISSELDDLDELCKTYPWIPNRNTIRPSPEELERKFILMEKIDAEWITLYDYILFQVFAQPYEINYKKHIPYISNISDWVFTESLFRYNLPPSTHHYVLWFSGLDYNEGLESIDVGKINTIITNELKKRTSLFDFAWYVNPKPSVPDLFHVQVFWIEL